MSKKKKNSFSQVDRFVIFVVLILFGFLLGVKSDSFKSFRLKIPFLSQKVSPAESISPKELKKMLDEKDFTFINVHTPYEGEIAGTDTFIEYDSMKVNEAQLPKDKNTAIVLYCKSGRMSAEALKTLKGMGYTNVRHLQGGMDAWEDEGFSLLDLSNLPKTVLPDEGFELPISWGDLGPRLVQLGVIDISKFEEAVKPDSEQKKILTQKVDAPVHITSQNSQFIVDVLWAIGLAQKSKVYTEGPMGKEYNKDVGNFASTGGWTLARGEAVNYLGKYDLIPLTTEQQDKVSEIAKNVYRPCCGNSTWFPDCNHGMAALAAIEMMVSKGLSDDEIYKNILKLNSFWFPQNYLTAATYFARQGIDWDRIDAKEVLGATFSSGQGAMEIAKKVGPLPYQGAQGGSCGA